MMLILMMIKRYIESIIISEVIPFTLIDLITTSFDTAILHQPHTTQYPAYDRLIN